MEDSVHNTYWSLRTHSHVLWVNKLPHYLSNDDEQLILGSHKPRCGGSLWVTCIIVCASSSHSISISFIGFLIHLISISILLYNYVIINSKSDATQKYIEIFLTFNYKTQRPLSPLNSSSFPHHGACCSIWVSNCSDYSLDQSLYRSNKDKLQVAAE